MPIDGVELASSQDVARWKAEFSRIGFGRSQVWVPQCHYHDKSESYVWGIKPEDGCWVCDNQWPLVEEAIRRGESVPCPLCVVVTKEFLSKVERRMRIFDGEFFYYDDEIAPKGSGIKVSLDFESKPTRDDITRWRKQFRSVLDRMQQKAAREAAVAESSKKKGIDSKYDLSPDEVVEKPEGTLQATIFGGLEEVSARRKKK